MNFLFEETFIEEDLWDEDGNVDEDVDASGKLIAPHLDELPQTSIDRMAIGVAKCGLDNILVEPLTPWFHCREFFNDYLFYYFADKHEGQIYGFDPAEYQLLPKNLVLLVKISQDFSNFAGAIENSIHELESIYGCNSYVHVITDSIIMVDFDRKWINNPVLFSIFTREVRWGVLLGQDRYKQESKYNKDRLRTPEHRTNFYEAHGLYFDKIPADPLSENIIPVVKNLFDMSAVKIADRYLTDSDNEYRFHNFGFCEYLKREHKQIVRDGDSGGQ
jgi:hypothetical protein